MLYILAGLPGTGKSTIARQLARACGAVWLRIDTIEQAMRDAGLVHGDMGGAGYEVAYALALDNLRSGLDVVADSVNPIAITRDAWRRVALKASARALEIEVVCSDHTEHRLRVETRAIDVPSLRPPTWQDVIEREYHAWDTKPLRIDTAILSPDEAVAVIRRAAAD